MPAPSVTYTLTNGTANDSGPVNTNFNDIIAALTDGTKDLSINAITLAGTITPSVSGVSGDLLPSADSTRDLGSTSKFWAQAYIDEVIVGDGTGTATTPNITINNNTGDSGIRLQVNNTSANAWDIYNDNSDSDKLVIAYGGTSLLVADQAGGNLELRSASTPDLVINSTGANDAVLRLRVNDDSANDWAIYNDNSDSDKLIFGYGGTSPGLTIHTIKDDPIEVVPDNISTATAPIENAIYPHNIIKAWAKLTAGAAGSVTITSGFNVDTASYSTTDLTVNLHTAMSSTGYAVIVSGADAGFTNRTYTSSVNSTTQFVIRAVDNGSGSSTNWASGEDVTFLILGTQ